MLKNLSSAAVMIGTLRVNELSDCMLGNFFRFLLLSADFFIIIFFSKNTFWNTISVK